MELSRDPCAVRRLPVAAIALSVLLVAVGCATPSQPQRAAAGVAGEPLGTNSIGEACRMAPARRSDGGTPETAAAYETFCGQWSEPSGRIFRVEGEDPKALASSGWWRARLDRLTTCGTPTETTILGDVPAVSLDCALRPGNWPYRALAAQADGRIYLADTIPASEPAMHRGIGLLAGRGGLPAGDEARDGAASAGLYSAGDLQAYRELLREAQHHNFLGAHAEAERRYREALALQQKLLPGDKGGLAFVLMHLALELSNQQRFTEADAMFARSGDLLPASTDATDEARWTSYKAIHFANQKRYQPALDWAQRASRLRLDLARSARPDLFRRYAGEIEPAGFVTAAGGRLTISPEVVVGGEAETALGDVVQSRYVEAAMLLELGRLEEATATLADAERVLALDPRVPRRWQPRIKLLQAEVAERGGDLDRAERLLRAGIETQREILPGARTEGLAEIALGRIQAARGQTAAALASFTRGFAIIRAQGGGLPADEVLPFLQVGAEGGRAAAGEDLGAAMFAAGQIVRSSVTGQTIAIAAARLAASEGQAGDLVRQFQDARRQRDALVEQLADAQASPTVLPPQLASLELRMQAAEAELARLERAMQAALPRYNQLVDAPVDLRQTIAALRPDEALVQLLVAEQGSFGLLVDADGVKVYPVPLTAAQAREAVAHLRTPFDARIGAPFDVAAAHDLYRALFGPVADRLARAQHVVVVPSGPLSSLPFAVLVSELPVPGGSADAGRVAWLARRHALTLAPSVQSFVQLRTTAQRTKASRPFVGFGDFVPARDAGQLAARLGLPSNCREEIAAVANLPRLPATATEVRGVAGALRAGEGSVHLGSDFSEASIEQLPLSEYRVVYLATHGLLPRELDCWAEPSLVVSPPSRADEPGDGLLLASEIAGLELDADLVVLSACNTAGADGRSSGESLSGLARAFFYAGARSLLVTHWQIPDEPTQRLMTAVFRDIAERDLSVAEALRRGQMAMADDPATAHPINWAAFAIVGDGDRRLGGSGGVPLASAGPAVELR